MQTVDVKGAPSCGSWDCGHDAGRDTQRFRVIIRSLDPVKLHPPELRRPKQRSTWRMDEEQSLPGCIIHWRYYLPLLKVIALIAPQPAIHNICCNMCCSAGSVHLVECALFFMWNRICLRAQDRLIKMIPAIRWNQIYTGMHCDVVPCHLY